MGYSWLSATFTPSKQNIVAGNLSWEFNVALEWTLHILIFNRIADHFGKPDVDLFASRINNQSSSRTDHYNHSCANLDYSDGKTHPLSPKLMLMVCRISGITSLNAAYLEELRRHYVFTEQLKSNITFTLENGVSFVFKAKLIQCYPLGMMC